VTTRPTPTTKPITTTTTPQQVAAKVQAKALQKIGASNRGVPNDERVVVSYTPGQDLLVTWAINNGTIGGTPTGTPTCTAPPTSTTSTTTTTTTTRPNGSTTTTTTTTLPKQRTTPEEARLEAKELLQSIKAQIKGGLNLDIPGVQLVGTYPIEGAGDDDVVQALYSKATVLGTLPSYLRMFLVPPAEVVQCLNPAFELA
jgi:anti-sigma28 factor (negative regulator of flagellin synthesis)